jgi:ABC-type hemin transport system substrate-binding protein
MMAVLMLLGALLSISGCDQASPDAPRQTPPTIPPPATAAPSPRIVSLSPAVSVILRDLGHAPRVVGRHAYELALDRTLPACGDQAGIDYEALLRVRPTHVFTQWGARELPERLRTLAAQQHWTLRDVNPLSLAQIADAITTLDAALQPDGAAGPHARELARQTIALGVPSPNAAPIVSETVLLLCSLAPPAALGPGSCHAELLAGLSIRPAVREGSAYLELSREDLVRMDPWGIVLFAPRAAGTDADTERSAEQRAEADPWAPVRDLPLRALREGRIVVVDDPLGLLPSSAMVGVAAELRSAVDAWRSAPADAPTTEPGPAPSGLP